MSQRQHCQYLRNARNRSTTAAKEVGMFDGWMGLWEKVKELVEMCCGNYVR